MKLANINLENYRRFDKFQMALHPELTVIAARNGFGKTTILEAIAASLGPFVGAFDMGKSEHIRRTDARYDRLGAGYENEQSFPVLIDAALSEPQLTWQRALNSAKGRTTSAEAAGLVGLGRQLQADLRRNVDTPLPVIRYYSSKRLWVSHKSVQSKATLTESRTAGYEDCLSSSSSFVQLQEWMRKATLAVVQQRTQPGYDTGGLASRLQGISDAVDVVMAGEGWSRLHYSLVFEELAMVHQEHGALPISLLSDGVRAMASLSADLALRCVRLNGYLNEKAPLASKGIVLIDEVDLHLHPAWQQRVVVSLREAFPQIQFIVSSHSPQVLTTVEQQNIRIVFKDNDGRWHAQPPDHEVLGLESSVALNDVMGVNPIPPVDAAQLIADYTALIERGEHDESSGRQIRERLTEIYGAGHAVLVDSDRLIRFQAFKLRKASGAGGS
ncbi:TPA: AAA family ATPase [Stenotrophomonas maltophilia]|nr:AAA family ATPase [Stenotrophomonas maltophilia]